MFLFCDMRGGNEPSGSCTILPRMSMSMSDGQEIVSYVMLALEAYVYLSELLDVLKAETCPGVSLWSRLGLLFVFFFLLFLLLEISYPVRVLFYH